MKEYIDKKLLIDTYCEENCGNRKCVDAFDRCIFISHVLEQPVADVKKVVHAKWIKMYGNLSMFFKCSKCRACNEFETRYCPDCGAKMDLK